MRCEEGFLVHSAMDLFCKRYFRVYSGRQKGIPGGESGPCKGLEVGSVERGVHSLICALGIGSSRACGAQLGIHREPWVVSEQEGSEVPTQAPERGAAEGPE